jgi:hypothetical protein
VGRTDEQQGAGDSAPFDLQGQLGNFLISDIIQMIGLSGKTGTLTLIQGWNRRTITFESGRISYVAAGNRLPGTFELLIRTNRLSRQQVEAFRARRPGKSEQEMIAELLQRGMLSREDIDRCNDLLLESAVYTLFMWRNCAFTFRAGEVVKEGGVPVTVDGNHLIIEGTRRVDEWIEISPVVPSIFMIFQRRKQLVQTTVPAQLRAVYDAVDGRRDVATIARVTGMSQFDAAKALYDLSQERLVESTPPNKPRVCELFNLTVESIYMKLLLYEKSRHALQLENDLNRFGVENKLKVRMSSGKIIRSDLDTQIPVMELIDLYKLFVGIQSNKLSKLFEPRVMKGLMEGLYLNADAELRSMMRQYEFFEMDGLQLLEMFGKKRPAERQRQTSELLAPG